MYRFVVRPHAAFDPVALRRFSDEQDQPLLLFSVDPAAAELRAPFTLAGDPVTLSSLRVADDGAAIVARIYNPSTKTASVTLRPSTPGSRVSVVASDGLQSTADGRVVLPPLATRVIRIELR
jgi:alpha-mannosidase